MRLTSPARVIAHALIGLLLPLGCASGEPSGGITGRATSRIIGGSADGTHPEVLAVINWDRASGGGLCTGTLIAEDVVLTAKHCVWHRLPDDSYAATSIDRVEVRLGPHAVDDVRETIPVMEIITTPGAYTPARIRAGEDLALLRLATSVTSAEPAPLATAAPAVGATVTIVGYGFIDAVARDVGRRYSGETQVAEVGAHLARTLGDAWTCQGDSGGPLLIDGAIAGVTSAGLGACVRDAQHLYTIVAPHLELIRSVLPMCKTCDRADEDCDGRIDEGVCADGGTPTPDAAVSADGGTGSPGEGCRAAPGAAGEGGLRLLLALSGLWVLRRRVGR